LGEENEKEKKFDLNEADINSMKSFGKLEPNLINNININSTPIAYEIQKNYDEVKEKVNDIKNGKLKSKKTKVKRNKREELDNKSINSLNVDKHSKKLNDEKCNSGEKKKKPTKKKQVTPIKKDFNLKNVDIKSLITNAAINKEKDKSISNKN
jgi:hypothetical protein